MRKAIVEPVFGQIKEWRGFRRFLLRGLQKVYQIDNPQVYELDGVRSEQSLYGFVNSQLGDEQISKLKIKQATPVKVLDGQTAVRAHRSR